MDEENLWRVCIHIFAKSTDEIELKPNKIATCKSCAILPPNSIVVLQPVSETLLRKLIKDLNIVDGIECLD
jgi:hypothetical protein